MIRVQLPAHNAFCVCFCGHGWCSRKMTVVDSTKSLVRGFSLTVRISETFRDKGHQEFKLSLPASVILDDIPRSWLHQNVQIPFSFCRRFRLKQWQLPYPSQVVLDNVSYILVGTYTETHTSSNYTEVFIVCTHTISHYTEVFIACTHTSSHYTDVLIACTHTSSHYTDWTASVLVVAGTSPQQRATGAGKSTDWNPPFHHRLHATQKLHQAQAQVNQVPVEQASERVSQCKSGPLAARGGLQCPDSESCVEASAKCCGCLLNEASSDAVFRWEEHGMQLQRG